MPGPRYTSREAVYTGNQALSASDLKKAVKLSGIGERIWSSPSDLQTVLVTAYHAQGYLGAQVTIGNATFEGNRATLPVQIAEGPVFKVGVARIDDPGTPPQGVDLTSPIEPGTVLTDTLVRNASRQLQQRYRVAGYRGTRVTAQSTFRSDKITADLVFKVARGERAVLGTLTVAGVEDKERALVEHLSAFTVGEPVSLDAINQARDRLYDTDLFRQVSIDTTSRPAPAGQRQSGVMDATISVDLLPKYRLQYGFQLFDPYRPATSPKWGSVDPGVVADLTRRGLFGRGITAGIAGRVNPSDRVARVYLSSRRIFGKPFQTNFYVGDEWQREISEAGLHAEQRTKDFTFDQRIRFRSVQLTYGYNFQKQDLRITSGRSVRAGAPNQGQPEPAARLVLLRSARQRDRHRPRLLPLDERRDRARVARLDGVLPEVPEPGLLLPPAARHCRPGVGGTHRARRGARPDLHHQRAPARRRVHHGARLRRRVARAAGAESIGHRTALLVLNEEIRFPIVRRFRGALFVDHASLFGEFNLPDLNQNRTSAGLGVRFVLPFLLLRVDYGYPLKQDSTNDHGRWYFAIGQAF